MTRKISTCAPKLHGGVLFLICILCLLAEMETRYEDGESVADAMEAGTDAIDDSSDGVEAQQMSPSQTVLDHQLNIKGKNKYIEIHLKFKQQTED